MEGKQVSGEEGDFVYANLEDGESAGEGLSSLEIDEFFIMEASWLVCC